MIDKLKILIVCLLLCSTTIAAQQTDWDNYLKKGGFIEVKLLIPEIRTDLVYSTTNNFTGKVLYHNLTKAWLHRDAALKLVKAYLLLKQYQPTYNLLIYDAARPMGVQEQMWELVKGTSNSYYVANPAKGGGLHNYGMAVDITIVDAQGNPLDMGTGFDFFGKEANIDNEQELVRQGLISKISLQNRLLLRKVMTEAGFTTVTSEWWHFNACSRATARADYHLID